MQGIPRVAVRSGERRSRDLACEKSRSLRSARCAPVGMTDIRGLELNPPYWGSPTRRSRSMERGSEWRKSKLGSVPKSTMEASRA